MADNIMTFSERFNLMMAEVTEGEKGDNPCSKHPNLGEHQGRLSLNTVKSCETLFQPRELNQYLSSDHIKTLCDALKNSDGIDLEPILVWWSGKHWYVIDGHHRLQAYNAYYRDKKCMLIPVSVFSGTLIEAIKKSTAANSRDKLPMSKSDKFERAWKLVCLSESSRSEIMELTGVSKGTVDNMRKRYRLALNAGETKESLLNSFWKDRYAVGKPKDYDGTYKEQLARDMAFKLRKVFGKQLSKNPDIVAMALESYNPELPRKMIEYEWLDHAKAVVEEAGASEENPDF